jgi:hypothetical protein
MHRDLFSVNAAIEYLGISLLTHGFFFAVAFFAGAFFAGAFLPGVFFDGLGGFTASSGLSPK